jgi:6-phosphogluconolactonase
VSPSGRLLFAANYDNGNVRVFSIDPVTGALTNVQGSPFTAGGNPNWVAVHPFGPFVYVVNNGGNNISGYTMNSTGALTLISATAFAAGAQPATMAIDPSGQFAYVANNGSGNISGYTINPSTGALTPMAGSPFAAGAGTFSVVVDPSGNYVYAANQGFGAQTINAYTLNPSTGALTQISGSPFTTGNGPARMSIVTAGPFAGTNPTPSVTQLAPSIVTPGGGNLLLTVYGNNFVPSSVARFNGSPRGTAYVSANQLNVALAAADVANAAAAQITVSNPTPGGGTSSAATLTVSASAAPPSVPSAGTVNAAGFQPGLAVVPGSIASVFGTNIAAQTTTALALPLPTTLGNSSVSFNGTTAAPLFFTASGQANIQIPWELAGPQHAFASFTSASGTGTLATVTLAQFAPGIFTINNSGTGQGAVTLANSATFAAPNGSIPGASAAPVTKGSFITIYCTGLGAVTNQPATGAAAPGGPNLAVTTTNPVVMIGGQPAPVSFSGLTPSYVGLYQVNAQVPSGAPSGSAVTLQLSIGGINANPVTIAIQ